MTGSKQAVKTEYAVSSHRIHSASYCYHIYSIYLSLTPRVPALEGTRSNWIRITSVHYLYHRRTKVHKPYWRLDTEEPRLIKTASQTMGALVRGTPKTAHLWSTLMSPMATTPCFHTQKTLPTTFVLLLPKTVRKVFGHFLGRDGRELIYDTCIST